MDVKYDTTPCDGTPGQPWEDFKRRLRNVATRSDDRGFSLADHFDDDSGEFQRLTHPDRNTQNERKATQDNAKQRTQGKQHQSHKLHAPR